jgi:cytochrome c biogenesis protein
VGELSLTLEEYFPDFALDEQRQPYTRSLDPKNPAALLSVESPRGRFRVFVLQAMPGVHRVEELDRSFALRGIEPEASVEIAVRREPLALGVLLGGLLVLAGVVLAGRAP